MKKKPKTVAKRVGACVGAAAISATMLTGCNWFGACDNREVAVYGPPPWREQDYDPADNQNEDVYGPPPFDDDYDPAEVFPETVYGPEWMLDGYDHDPADDLPEPVYGPPEDFGLEEPVEGEQP